MHGVEKREQKKKGWVHWKCLSTMEDFDRTYKRHCYPTIRATSKQKLAD